MLWLDDNIQRILNEKIPISLNYLFNENFKNSVKTTVDSAIQFCEKNTQYKTKIEYLKNLNLFEQQYNRENDIEIIKKIWEFPIVTESFSKNKFTIGFIDLAVTYSQPLMPFLYGLEWNNNNYSSEREIVKIEEELKIKFENKIKTIYIEVKTEIDSLGTLIRQINLYRQYLPGIYFVMCPDNTHKSKLAEQEIYFIEVDELK